MDDIKTLISAASLLFAYLCFRWNRRENRLDALSTILKPLLQAVQLLNDANTARRSAEQLKIAYPDPEKAPEAIHRHNDLVGKFNELNGKASDAFKQYERDLAACKFRFPDKVGKLLQTAKEDLTELGKYVNGGFFDQADIAVAKVIDDHTAVSKYARGWRLADPVEGIRKRWDKLRRKAKAQLPEHELDETQMQRVMDLVTKRATSCLLYTSPSPRDRG